VEWIQLAQDRVQLPAEHFMTLQISQGEQLPSSQEGLCFAFSHKVSTARSHFIHVQETSSLHFTSLHFTSLHFTSLHFTAGRLGTRHSYKRSKDTDRLPSRLVWLCPSWGGCAMVNIVVICLVSRKGEGEDTAKMKM
jgi:hypothetical protein